MMISRWSDLYMSYKRFFCRNYTEKLRSVKKKLKVKMGINFSLASRNEMVQKQTNDTKNEKKLQTNLDLYGYCFLEL